MLADAVFAAAEFADCGPGFGGESGAVEVEVGGHIDLGFGPGVLVGGGHAETGPDVFGYRGGLLLGEAVGEAYVAMRKEVSLFSFCEGRWGRCHVLRVRCMR